MEHRKTLLMGWVSWNAFRTHISEETIKKQVETLVETGLAACGYTYVNIDDGFFGGRDENGRIKTHPQRFPNGMKVLADHIHSLGLKAGIYSDAGDHTCGHYYDNEGENGMNVGLYGHEEEDLRMYLMDWDYDFIKIDWCGGLRISLDEETQYTRIGKIIEKIREEKDSDIIYNVCRWQFPGEWVAKIVDSWRTGSDIAPDFDSILHQLDMVKPLREYCGPGHVNDLDMLQIGNGMTLEEDITHFIMWCMISTLLMIGCDLTKLDKERIEMLSNPEMIRIHQDPACLQAYVVKENLKKGHEWEIWIKDLGKKASEDKAVVFLNRSREKVRIRAQLEEIGLSAADFTEVRVWDLRKHKALSFDGVLDLEVHPHSCIALRISAPKVVPVKDLVIFLKSMTFERISEEAFNALEKGSYHLVDVRSEEEYDRGHLDGARNFPYTGIHCLQDGIFQKEDRIILYCTTGKRSSQAAKSLALLGYTNLMCMICSNL